jgi:hypothetical protein
MKKDLMEEYDTVDIKAETSPLSDSEVDRLKFIQLEMQKLWFKEEVKAKQHSRDRDILEGDRNTAYFHAVANQRRRKTLIHTLEGPDGPSSDLNYMLKIATDFYKDLFKAESREDFSLSEDFFSDNEIVSTEVNASLDKPFTEEEVRHAVFSSYSDGAPGPDGLSFMCYQKIWHLVKDDVMAMFRDFHLGKLDLFRLNFVVLSLIPKEPDASSMKKFRPISLLNCIFKIFTKVLTNRLGLLMNFLISLLVPS